MSGTVFIGRGATTFQFPIDDVTPDILEECFNLGRKPTVLLHGNSNLVIHHRIWRTSLVPGNTYVLPIEQEATSDASKPKDTDPLDNMGEQILHAWIASSAVYRILNDGKSDNCKQYLMNEIKNHFFDFIIPSLYGPLKYLIGKERNADRIYIALHGSQELITASYCKMEKYQDGHGNAFVEGKFHSGYLQLANCFPVEAILSEEQFRNMDIVVCGHSFGGAIAAIISIRLEQEKRKLKLAGITKCITFGAPLFGDATLEKTIAVVNMFHFTCYDDHLPLFLSHIQWLYCIIDETNAQIAFLNQNSNAGTHYRDKLISDGNVYNACLRRILAVSQPMLSNGSGESIEPCRALDEIKSSTFLKNNAFVRIGKHYILNKNGKCRQLTSLNDTDSAQNYEKSKSDSHALTNYHFTLEKLKHPLIPFGSCPGLIHDHGSYKLRDVLIKDNLKPSIKNTALAKVDVGYGKTLRLSLTGSNLFTIILQECEFGFSFPFATDARTTKLGATLTEDNQQRVVIESPLKEEIAIPIYGISIGYVTQFGKCSTVVREKDVRGEMLIQSVRQISQNDSASLVLRRAIQRGMAISSLKTSTGEALSNRILSEIKELGGIIFGSHAMAQKYSSLESHAKNSLYTFSNEKAYKWVRDFCYQMECFLQSPIEIKAKWSVMQKIACGLIVGTAAVGAGALGAGAVAYLLGPILGYFGMAVAGSSSTASALFVGASSALNAAKVAGKQVGSWLVPSVPDSNYENAIRWIIQQLLVAKRGTLPVRIRSEITDLQDEGGIYSQERILSLLTQNSKGRIDFRNSDLDLCTDETKEIVKIRIKAIQKIHNIREVFLQQCFIGIIGLQDAGKTTLVKAIWGVGDKIGLFEHTDVPSLYQVAEKVFVVDFPGSSSLEEHGKTFSICGVMNNMVIVLIPFTGDISKMISDELQKVFDVMLGSNSTKMLLCVNKCGLYFNQLQQQLKDHRNPIEYMKKRFADKLNEYYKKNGAEIKINENDIFFTDWEIKDDSEARKFGIVGVDGIKTEIKNYLVTSGIYKTNEAVDLHKCISKLSI